MQEETEQKALKAFLIVNRGYTQLINQYTSYYHTQIDHIYTNMPHLIQSAGQSAATLVIGESLADAAEVQKCPEIGRI